MKEQNVQIGKSGVLSTPLGLGANAVGGTNLFPNLNDETGIEVVKSALDSGIKLIDTAFMYGLGHSEELVGKAIQGYDRGSFAIATKGAQEVVNGQIKLNNDPKFLKQAVYDSLKRLHTNYIDIFYIHFPDDHTPKNEAIKALNELKVEGVIKAIGVSNFSLDQLKEANQDDLVDIVEDRYNLVHREAETELFPYLKEHDISFVPYFPLASGLLTGKYDQTNDHFPENDSRSKNPDFQGDRFKKILAAIDQIKPLADQKQITLAQLVLAWYIKNPNISVVIPGAKQPEQVASNAKAMDVTLTDAEYDKIDQAFAAFKA
ncbi:aldo/keto reductase [Nicoliella lavandulae]|uniref:Aldo/keto reductase n=1 Tax=Nicoliella lavandulae TaxID=3082954 RepID=A0ABU8SJG8_9LACO